MATDQTGARADRGVGRRLALAALSIGVLAAVAALVKAAPWRPDHVTIVRVVTAGGAAGAPQHAYTNPDGSSAPVAPDPRQLPAPAVAAAAGPAPPGPSAFRGGVHAAFARLTTTLPGRVQIAVLPVGAGRIETLGGDTPAHGWSTTKVPVLAALMRSRGTAGLTSAERQWAQAAITASDNQSVLDLFGDLERRHGGLVGASAYVQALLRASGDSRTVVATGPPPAGAVTTFGQTEWSPGEAVKFFRALGQGCLLPSAQSAYVVGLMERIVSSESWGIGSGGFTGPVAFKGGWGPEPSGAYLVRQSAIIAPGSTSAVSNVAYPPAGGDSFGTGTTMLTRTAQWLRHELRLVPRAPAACVGA